MNRATITATIASCQTPKVTTMKPFSLDLDPLELDSFMRDAGGSPREIAALMRRTGVGKPILVTWVNQFADDPDWHDSEALTVCLGEWCRTRMANR